MIPAKPSLIRGASHVEIRSCLGAKTAEAGFLISCANSPPSVMRRTGADMLHPSALADLALPSLPGARCRDEWRLFDAAAGAVAAAVFSVVFASGSRRSMRAAMVACRVAGTATSATSLRQT